MFQFTLARASLVALVLAACSSEGPPAPTPVAAGGSGANGGNAGRSGASGQPNTAGSAGSANAGADGAVIGGASGEAGTNGQGGADAGASGTAGAAGIGGSSGGPSRFFVQHLGSDKNEVCSAVTTNAKGTTFGGSSEGFFQGDPPVTPAGPSFFMRKLDPYGATLWTRTRAGRAAPSMFAPSPSGGTYALIAHEAGFDLGLGPLPAEAALGLSLVRFDGEGTLLWQVPLPKRSLLSQIASVGGSAIVVGLREPGGSYVMAVDNDGAITFDRTFPDTAVLQAAAVDAKGDVVVVGATTASGIDDATGTETLHGLVATLDNTTGATKSTTLSGPGVVWHAVAAGPQGLWVGGRYEAESAAELGLPAPVEGTAGVLARLDESRAVAQAWGFAFTQPLIESNAPFALFSNIAVRADGTAYATMLFRGTGDVLGQARTSSYTENWGTYLLLKIPSDGAAASARELSVGAEDDALHAQLQMTLDTDGVVLAGSFGDAMGADLGGEATFGAQDVFVARVPF